MPAACQFWTSHFLVGLGLVALGAFLALTANAADPPATPDAGSYPEPVEVPTTFAQATRARQAMVAAAHPLAAKAGIEILKAGGNAIDATIAVQMVLNVVEPQSSGIGGGCFILYHDAKNQQTYCLDGREETPCEARRSDFLDSSGKIISDDLTGGLPVGVPGTVAAMWKAHARWGKLPIDSILAPAIRLAEDGVGVTPRLRASIQANQKRFLRFPSSRAIFLHADGSVPEIGEVLKQPDLARTLRLLAAKGPQVFYEGEIAADIVKTVRNATFQPGRLSLEDLKAYRAVERTPVRFSYRGHEVVGMPPPSSGGITLGLTLGLLEPTDLGKTKPGTLEELELLARAGAAAFAARNAYLGDQDWNPDLDMRGLLGPRAIQDRRDIAWKTPPGQKFRAGPAPLVTPAATDREEQGEGAPLEGDNTTHFSIVDAERNVVACTTTIEHGMGSGLVVEGRGFLLNNELTDFDLDVATGPNALDATRGMRRSALDNEDQRGGKRPRSSMTPVIVFKNGKPCLSAGSPGGSLIIGIVAQALVNVLDHGMDMQQALNAPRISSRNGALGLEALYSNRKQLQAALEARGWKVARLEPTSPVWGGAQGIRILPDGTLEGGADPRREGAVRGY